MKLTPFCSQILPMGAMDCSALFSIVVLWDMVMTGFITVQWMVRPVYVTG